MEWTLASIGARTHPKDPFEETVSLYLARCSAVAKTDSEWFKSEQGFLEWLARRQGRTSAMRVLLDSRGKQMTSEGFASWLGARRDEGARQIVFAIGPASGWSDQARAQAQLLLSLGSFTMAHALARLVMAEQLYRASTILTGHPYHTGH